MKICHISSVHDSEDIRIFKKQCITLAKDGHNVTFIVNNVKDEVKFGVEIKALKKRTNAIARLFFNLPTILMFTFKNKFDVYHAHDPELLPILFFLKLLGRNVVYDMHENFPKQLKTKRVGVFVKKIVGIVWPAIERIILSRINVVYAELSYKEDYPFVKKSVDVLNMPILDELKEIAVEKHDEFSICYLGGVSEDRYTIKTLETLKKLNNEGINIRFDLVGPVSDQKTFSAIKKYETELPNFHYHGSLPPEKAWRLIAKSHVGLAVLNPIPNYIGSYPTKMFEYLALGMPVITSDFELYKPIIERHQVGFCIDPLSDTEFEKALVLMMNEPKLRADMSVRAGVLLDGQYSWADEYMKLSEFYTNIVC